MSHIAAMMETADVEALQLERHGWSDVTDVIQYYRHLSELDRRDREMNDYEQGKRDCEEGIPHYNKSEAYTQGYSDQYNEEQSNEAE